MDHLGGVPDALAGERGEREREIERERERERERDQHGPREERKREKPNHRRSVGRGHLYLS